jgi:hypothetical protein
LSSIDDAERVASALRKLAEEEEGRAAAAERAAERARLIDEDDKVGPDPALTEFDYLLLVCCAPLGGASATDIIAFAKKMNFGLGSSERTVYNRLRALKRRGLLEAEPAPGRRGGERTQYVAVGDAPKFIRQWLQTPVRLPSFDAQLLIRLHAGHSSAPGRITGGLMALRPALERHLARIDLNEREARLMQAEAGWMLTDEMSYDLQRTLTRAYLEWFAHTLKKLPPNIDRGFRQ